MYVYGLGQISFGPTTAVKTPSLAPTARSAPPAPSSPQVATTMFAQIAPSVATMATPTTTRTVQLAPIQTQLLATAAMKSSGTKPAAGGGTVLDVTGKMAYDPAAKAKTAGGVTVPSGPSAPPPDFGAACKQEGGTFAGGICTLPTGEQITLQDGKPVCVKNVPNGKYCKAAAAAGGAGKAVMIGAAALAALMLLR